MFIDSRIIQGSHFGLPVDHRVHETVNLESFWSDWSGRVLSSKLGKVLCCGRSDVKQTSTSAAKMLAIRPLRNICKVFFQARCLSTLLAVGKQKTEAFSVIDPDEIKLKEIVNLRGRKFLPGGDKESFPQFLSGPKPDFPLALKAEGHYSIEDWGKLCREEIDGSLYEFGAILFRDLPLATTDDFQQLFASIGFPAMNYIGGSAHRENVAFQVYSASDEPPDCCIDLHNEMSYSPVYNNKVCGSSLFLLFLFASCYQFPNTMLEESEMTVDEFEF